MIEVFLMLYNRCQNLNESKLTYYKGNYDVYTLIRDDNIRVQNKEFNNQEKNVKILTIN